MKSIINYFPKVFENDHATIYEVPHLTPPSTEASLGVLYFPPSMQKHEASEWVEDSFTDGWYPYRQYGSVKSYVPQIINGSIEASVTSNQPGNVWASYALSNLSLNTTTYPVISFRYRVENDFTWFTLQLLNSSNKVFFYKGHLTDKTFTTKSYSLPDDQTITRVEILVETTDKTPTGSSAIAYLDNIEISQKPFSSDDAFPALFTASFQSKYSFLYANNALMKNLDIYVSRYRNILLTSDPPISIDALIKWVSSENNLEDSD